jgi:hypothetical protein
MAKWKGWPATALGNLDSGLMAKDKSEKKKRVSDVVPAAVEEVVEMEETKVCDAYTRVEELYKVMQEQDSEVAEEG